MKHPIRSDVFLQPSTEYILSDLGPSRGSACRGDSSVRPSPLWFPQPVTLAIGQDLTQPRQRGNDSVFCDRKAACDDGKIHRRFEVDTMRQSHGETGIERVPSAGGIDGGNPDGGNFPPQGSIRDEGASLAQRHDNVSLTKLDQFAGEL